MKKKRFTEEQIIAVLKESEAGAATKDLCRKHGISEPTFYNWKAKYAGMTVSEARRLKELESENAKLKKLLAEAELDKAALKDLLGPKMVSPQAKREAVSKLMTERDYGVTRACGLLQISRSLYRYRSRRPACAKLCERIREIAEQKRRYGYRRIYIRLRREGWAVNRKRVYRLYREAGLLVRRRKRKRIGLVERKPLPKPAAANISWSMDFVSDGLADGRRLRCLNIVDDCTRECVAIEVDTSITGTRVKAVLERLADARGLPKSITVDHGPEFEGQVLDAWAYEHAVQLSFIRPGKPNENAYIESFNGKFRDECLNEHWFVTMAQARRIIEAWRIEYNTERTHSSLGDLTPEEFAEECLARETDGVSSTADSKSGRD
ncbi:MAG TPA: IS3 family transposase [Terriglobia bacterium]|nr:IS3 family transposase [Terriglobia bacterium]